MLTTLPVTERAKDAVLDRQERYFFQMEEPLVGDVDMNASMLRHFATGTTMEVDAHCYPFYKHLEKSLLDPPTTRMSFQVFVRP